MLYTILCYNDEDVVWSWSKEEDAAVMANLDQALDAARELAAANPGGAYEIRPSRCTIPTSAADD